MLEFQLSGNMKMVAFQNEPVPLFQRRVNYAESVCEGSGQGLFGGTESLESSSTR